MTPNVRTASLVSIALAAVVSLGCYGLHTARTAEAARAAVAKKRAALDVAIRGLEATIAANKQAAEKAAAAHHESPWHVTADAGNAATRPLRPVASTPSPKVAALLSAAFRAGLAQKYGCLYQTLGLTPAQIDAFENLLTAHRNDLLDLRTVAAASDLDDAGPEIAAIRQEENDNFRAALTNLLGPAGVQQLQQANRIMPVQNFVNGLELSTGFPPETLSASQAQQLSTVLAHASSSYQNGGAADPATVDWDAVLPQAQGILSINQFEGLKASIYQIQLDQYRKQFFQREQGTKTQ